MSDARTAVEKADYVLLTTFRKDGTPVPTPLWAAADRGKIFVWTVTDSWKVKRLRRNPSVTLQPCNAKGTPTAPPSTAPPASSTPMRPKTSAGCCAKSTSYSAPS